tara:strand:- start:423 stop:692 length:270 start_codon:yes stop_codon:yes gene_type:complete
MSYNKFKYAENAEKFREYQRKSYAKNKNDILQKKKDDYEENGFQIVRRRVLAKVMNHGHLPSDYVIGKYELTHSELHHAKTEYDIQYPA